MKKSNLWTGVIFILLGVSCLGAAIFFDTELDSLLFEFSGAGIIPGFVAVFKYFYWNSDKNRERYAARMEAEQIDLHDERKEKLRDKSGRYAYITGLIVIILSILVIGILEKLGVSFSSKFVIAYLLGYLIFQYIIGVIIYKRLSHKY